VPLHYILRKSTALARAVAWFKSNREFAKQKKTILHLQDRQDKFIKGKRDFIMSVNFIIFVWIWFIPVSLNYYESNFLHFINGESVSSISGKLWNRKTGDRSLIRWQLGKRRSLTRSLELASRAFYVANGQIHACEAVNCFIKSPKNCWWDAANLRELKLKIPAKRFN